MVDIPVMTLGAQDASDGRVVLFTPDLVEVVVEELIFAPRDNCLMASASKSLQALLQLRMQVRKYLLFCWRRIAEYSPLLPRVIFIYGLAANKGLNNFYTMKGFISIDLITLFKYFLVDCLEL